MFAMRRSGATAPNAGLVEVAPKRREGNAAWLERAGVGRGVLLLGGASLVDVRLRWAQSTLRTDLTPSHWSFAGLMEDGGNVLSVPLEPPDDLSSVPARNGIRRLPLAAFDDPGRYPNVAVLLFAESPEPAIEAVDEVRSRRVLLDLPALIVAWLAWCWGVTDVAPLRDGKGIPSAAFVQLCHGIAGIELTPGLVSTASCPEAMWQSARWWGDYYREAASMAARVSAAPADGHGRPRVPGGVYAIRQPIAAAIDPSGDLEPPAKPATRRRGTTR